MRSKLPKFVVRCDVHGTEKFKGGPKELFVGAPASRRIRTTGGCPMCGKARSK